MDPVHAIFKAFGGPAVVGRIIGKPVEHATLMRRRKSIPLAYWPALIAHAEAEGIQNVTYAALVAAHATRRPQVVSQSRALSA